MWTPFRQHSAEVIIEDRSAETGGHRSDYVDDLDYDDPIFHFDWAGDFNLEDPIDRKKAQQLARLCEVANHTFYVFKTVVTEGEVVEKQILELDHFPGGEETYHSVQEQWEVVHTLSVAVRSPSCFSGATGSMGQAKNLVRVRITSRGSK